MTSYFDEIAMNRLKSIILLFAFSLLFLAIIYFFVILLGGGIFGLVLGLLLVIGYAAFTYFFGANFILSVSRAKEVDRKLQPILYEIIEGLSAAMQLPMPKVYVINDPNPNALATGKNRKAACVAVTSGLLATMNKEELEGVLAHEMSHVADNDIQYMMVAIVFAGVIGLIAALIRNMLFFWGFRGGDRRDGGIILIIAFVVGLLAPLFALLIQFAISRKREYMADANGARITRNPEGLANALKKLLKYNQNPNARPVASANEITAALYFSSPFKPSSIMNLFSTHPPLEERISRLEKMY